MSKEPVDAWKLQHQVAKLTFRVERLEKENITLRQQIADQKLKLENHVRVTHLGWGHTKKDADHGKTRQQKPVPDPIDPREEKAG